MYNLLPQSPPPVVKLCGNLDHSTVHSFRSTLETKIRSEQCFEILIDLSQVEFIDMAGLAAISSVLLIAKQFDCKLIFCQVTPPIKLLFELTQLDRVLEISDK